MSTAGPDEASASAASDVAGALREAEFVRLVARADGDSLAATGVLARALGAHDTPFQATVAGPFADASRGTEADLTLAVGHGAVAADVAMTGPDPVSAAALEVVRGLDETPDPVLALAGTRAAGERDERVAEAAEQAGVERRPGVAIPVADLADGLAHSTLVSAPFSGDEAAVADALADLELGGDLDDEDRRRVASLVALAVAGSEAATDRAANAVQRALRPYVGGPFETVGGYADVLDAVARDRPGVGVALALGHDGVAEAALAAWREHGKRAHEAVATAETDRYDGCYVVRGDSMPVGTVARLVAEFRSPEPVTLAVGDGAAAARATDGHDVATPLDSAAREADGDAAGRDDRARARFAADRRTLVDGFLEAL